MEKEFKKEKINHRALLEFSSIAVLATLSVAKVTCVYSW